MYQLNSTVPSTRRQVTIAGQVIDALTQKPLAGATVKIVSAPDPFIQQILQIARLLVSLKPAIAVRSPLALSKVPDPAPKTLEALSKQLKDETTLDGKRSIFRSFFADPQISSQTRWNGFEMVLNTAPDTLTDQFGYVQDVLDWCAIPTGLSRRTVERTQTAIDGWFYFLDLPDGKYTLEAVLPSAGTRYGTAGLEPLKANASKSVLQPVNQITVVQGQHSTQPYQARLWLVPTTLAGRVTNAGGEGVSSAKVQIAGRQEYAVTSDESGYSNYNPANFSLLFGEPFNNGSTPNKNKAGYYILANLEAFTTAAQTPLKMSVVDPVLGDRGDFIPSESLTGVTLQSGEIRSLNFQFQPKSSESTK